MVIASGPHHSLLDNHDDELPAQRKHYYSLGQHYEYLRSLITPESDQIIAGSKQIPLPAVHHQRKLLSTSAGTPRVHSFEMSMTAIDTALAVEHTPDSPPELSSSKSSKSSSSFRSSCLSEAAGPENLSHFEDIALADSGRDSTDLSSHHRIDKKPFLARPPPRPIPASMITKNKGAHTMDSMHAIHMAKPRYPSLRGQVNGVLQETSGNNGRIARPVYRTPSQSSMALTSVKTQTSRSPSPIKEHMGRGTPSSPRSANGQSPHSLSSRNGFNRRQSWQPGRKTVKQLEAEYHDSDEEVPEDAVIWNVPITPVLPNMRSSRSPSPKKKASQTSLRSQNNPSTPQNISKQVSAPQALQSSVSSFTLSPNSPHRMGLPRSATVASFPSEVKEPMYHKERTKSWAADLSEEARMLSAALEVYASHVEGEPRLSNGSASSSPPRPYMSKRANTSRVELPPVHKGNIMIDPLPISKEKEAVLARTRPSWLPPKCKKEEKRHLKEWEKMMALSVEAEKRRAARQLHELESARHEQGSIARIWEEHVLPNWDAVIPEPRTRELWWRGVTPKNRGTVWCRAIGNELELSTASYEAALARSKKLEQDISQMAPEDKAKSKEAAWLANISRDVPTVFPELGIFTPGSPLHDNLRDLLSAYTAYRSDVGYVYGTHLVAGLIILNSSPAESFIALANLLNRPLPLAYLVQDRAAIDRWQDHVLSTLKYKLPALHDHLLNPATGIAVHEWLKPMFSTLLVHHLDIDTASRIWDVYVFEGDKVLVRAVVGILSRLESKLYGSRDEVLALLGWGDRDASEKWTLGSEEEVMKAIREAGKVSGSSSTTVEKR